jgi:hypothetical protein
MVADQPKHKNEQPEHTAADRKGQKLSVNVFHAAPVVIGGPFSYHKCAKVPPFLPWVGLLQRCDDWVNTYTICHSFLSKIPFIPLAPPFFLHSYNRLLRACSGSAPGLLRLLLRKSLIPRICSAAPAFFGVSGGEGSSLGFTLLLGLKSQNSENPKTKMMKIAFSQFRKSKMRIPLTGFAPREQPNFRAAK